jgi:hypothetical protein
VTVPEVPLTDEKTVRAILREEFDTKRNWTVVRFPPPPPGTPVELFAWRTGGVRGVAVFFDDFVSKDKYGHDVRIPGENFDFTANDIHGDYPNGRYFVLYNLRESRTAAHLLVEEFGLKVRLER